MQQPQIEPVKPEDVVKAILEKAAFRIAKARTTLVMRPEFVFWSVAALHLKPVPTISLPTAGVDGTHLYYNPLLVASNKWSDGELLFVIAHEAGHCMLLDHARRGSREPRKWNVACDHRLNLILQEAGLKDMPKGGLADPRFRGWAAERIYPEITDDDAEKAFGGPAGAGEGLGDCGGAGTVLDAPAPAGSDSSAAQAARDASAHEWDVIARSAAYTAQAQGKLPGAFSHLLQPQRPKLDPRAILRQFISMANRNDYIWSRPNRRFVGSGLYLPSLRSESVGPVCIAIDTSGSIDDAIAARFLGFVNAVLVDVKPERTWLLQCDARIQHEAEFGPGECLPAKVTIHGRGGTDMRPIWAWQQEKRIRPVCTIVLSDMCMSEASFGRDPGHPVLWLSSVAGERAPFGTTIDMPMED